VVELFLKKGADINAKDQGDGTALHEAVYGGHEKVVQLLLDKGAGILAEDERLLLMAAESGQ
jgi:ankyrin repeat protein